MNGFLLAIAFLLSAPGRIYALSPFQVPPPAKTEQPAKAVSLHTVIPHRTAVVSLPAGKKDDNRNSRSRTVMPVLLEYLPYAQALQEGMPGITATPSPNNKNPMTFAMVIPLTPEDLPVQSPKPTTDMKDDMRDALAPAHDPADTFNRLSWWTRILPAPAFNILLQKLYFSRSKAPEFKTGEPGRPAVRQPQIYQEEAVLRQRRRAARHQELSESGSPRRMTRAVLPSPARGEETGPANGGANVPSLADEIFNQ